MYRDCTLRLPCIKEHSHGDERGTWTVSTATVGRNSKSLDKQLGFSIDSDITLELELPFTSRGYSCYIVESLVQSWIAGRHVRVATIPPMFPPMELYKLSTAIWYVRARAQRQHWTLLTAAPGTSGITKQIPRCLQTLQCKSGTTISERI
jgi:hypothetical protein